MRRKIREIMNKEEGFTLVELLAVLAILAIIVAIAVPVIGNVIGNSETKAKNANEELIVDAARLYDIEKTEGRGTGNEFVTVGTLVSNGYLDLRSDSTDKDEEREDGVQITRIDDGGTTYQYFKTKTEADAN